MLELKVIFSYFTSASTADENDVGIGNIFHNLKSKRSISGNQASIIDWMQKFGAKISLTLKFILTLCGK